MHLFLLGGNSRENWDWLRRISEELDPLFSDSTLLYYEHWKLNSDIEEADIPIEAERLRKLIEDSKENDYAILAKGAGIIVSLKAVRDYELKPKACFFLGFPISLVSSEDSLFGGILLNWDTPTLFIQNSSDEQGAMQQLRKLIVESRIRNFETEEYPGKTSNYARYGEMKEDIGRFLGKLN